MPVGVVDCTLAIRLRSLNPLLRQCLALLLVVALAVLVYATPEPSRHWRSLVEFCDFGHVLAFAMTSFALFHASGVSLCERFGRGWTVAGAALLALAIGALVEWLQSLAGGNGELGDVWRDAGGAISAALLLLAHDLSLTAWRRYAYRSLAVVILGWFFLPTARAGFDELMALREFPLLVSFAHARELRRFEALPVGARVTSYRDPQGVEQTQLRMHWPAEKYPGFELGHFPGDWRGWRALSIAVVSLGSAPITVNVRVDDAHYRYELDASDRYDGRFTLQPGPNAIDVPLALVAKAPRNRNFDLARVRTVLVHGVGLTQPTELLLRRIELLH
jgi:hypothetical protein